MQTTVKGVLEAGDTIKDKSDSIRFSVLCQSWILGELPPMSPLSRLCWYSVSTVHRYEQWCLLGMMMIIECAVWGRLSLVRDIRASSTHFCYLPFLHFFSCLFSPFSFFSARDLWQHSMCIQWGFARVAAAPILRNSGPAKRIWRHARESGLCMNMFAEYYVFRRLLISILFMWVRSYVIPEQLKTTPTSVAGHLLSWLCGVCGRHCLWSDIVCRCERLEVWWSSWRSTAWESSWRRPEPAYRSLLWGSLRCQWCVYSLTYSYYRVLD